MPECGMRNAECRNARNVSAECRNALMPNAEQNLLFSIRNPGYNFLLKKKKKKKRPFGVPAVRSSGVPGVPSSGVLLSQSLCECRVRSVLPAVSWYLPPFRTIPHSAFRIRNSKTSKLRFLCRMFFLVLTNRKCVFQSNGLYCYLLCFAYLVGFCIEYTR